MGAHMIEADVRRAPDGRLVLAHDPVDDATGLVELGELLGLAAERVALDLELKEDGLEEDVLSMLGPYPKGLVVTSFRATVIERIATLAPDLTLGLLLEEGDGAAAFERADACRATFVAPHWSLVRELRVEALVRRTQLAVWTVNETAMLSALAVDAAVGVLITDRPDTARTLL